MTQPRLPSRRIGPRGALGFVAAGLASLALSAALLVVPRRVVHRPGPVDRGLARWGRWWLRALRARVEVSGLEHIRPGQPYVIVANHQSALDPMVVLAALPLRVRFLAKVELFRLPVVGSAMRRLGMVAVDRGSVDARGVTDGADRVLAAGRSLLVFPEGTVSADGGLLPFKPGAFAIAQAHGVPVLPVTISGTRAAWPVGGGRLVPHPVTVHVAVGEELATAGGSRRDIVALRAQARDAIGGALTRLAPAPGGTPAVGSDGHGPAATAPGQAGGSGSLRVGSTVSTTSPVVERSTR